MTGVRIRFSNFILRSEKFTEAVLPARWETVRARDFDGAASNQVRDN